MASVPNMRPTAGIPAGDGKPPAEGDPATANSPFATLLAIGTPKTADATPAPQGPAADLLTALQRALTGGLAPATGRDGAATVEENAKDASAGEGDDDETESATADSAGTDAAPADLLPLIEAQNAAPVTVTPAPTPSPKSDGAIETNGRTPPRLGGRPIRASGHPAKVEAAASPRPPVISVPLPAATTPSPPAEAVAETPAAAILADGASADRVRGAKTATRPVVFAGSPQTESKLDGMPQRASSVPAVPARPATDRAVAPPAEARSGSAPTAAGDEKPAAIIPAAPPTPAPNPLVAVQAALATMGDATPDPAHAIASTNDAATTPIAERVMGHQLDLARDSAWLDRLARDIAGSADSDGPMRFRLHPDTLGQMRVELSQSDRGTSVRLTVETETARSLVADAQPKLVAEARAQGVRIAETHVDLAGGSGGQASSDPRRQEAAREPVFVRTAHPAADGGEAENRPRRGRGERYA